MFEIEIDSDYISRGLLNFQTWREEQYWEWTDHVRRKSDLILEHWDPCPEAPDELAAWIAIEFFGSLTYRHKVKRKQSHWWNNGYPIDPIILSAAIVDRIKKHIGFINRKLESEVVWWLQVFLNAEDR